MKRRMGMALWMVALFIFCCVVVAGGPALAQKDKKEIVVGTDLPLSGALAMVGGDHRWGYDQAVKDINKGGGIFIKEYGKKLPLRLVVVDDETDPGKAA